jgi:predicted GNAT family acetyltransferase
MMDDAALPARHAWQSFLRAARQTHSLPPTADVLRSLNRTEQRMQFTKHTNAGAFLASAQDALERNEAANNLMLGLASRVLKYPERIRLQPYFATVRAGPKLAAAALMTPPFGVIVQSQASSPQTALLPIADNLQADRWPVPFVNGEAHAADAFAKLWQSLAGAGVKQTIRERVYQLDHVIAPHWPAGVFRLAKRNDLNLVTAWVDDFNREALPHNPPIDARDWAFTAITDGDVYLWEVEGEPVSMARKSRGTQHGQAIGPVYTPPAHRGCGYASAVTAKLSQMILSSGKRFAMLFTDLSNPTSNSIYQKIGFKPVCDYNQHFFS